MVFGLRGHLWGLLLCFGGQVQQEDPHCDGDLQEDVHYDQDLQEAVHHDLDPNVVLDEKSLVFLDEDARNLDDGNPMNLVGFPFLSEKKEIN